jgi:copper(I)-binding protein
MRFKAISIAIAGLFLATAAEAADVQISDSWFRYLTPQVPAGGYFTLKNTGKSEIALTGATSTACSMLMLHQSMNMGGMSSMEDVKNVPVPPGGSVKFAPGGYHLMCMNPTPAMKPGATVGVTLKFSDNSEAKAGFAVKNAQGK